MRIVWTMLFALLTWSSVTANQRYATESDLAKLRSDLSNLEAELTTIDAAKLPERSRERVESIRDNVIYLKVKAQKHEQSGADGTGVLLDEVRDLRLEIADFRNEVRDHVAATPAKRASVILPSGTEFAVRLEDSLSSATANPGDRFSASVVTPVVQNNSVVLKAGATLTGRVELVDRTEGRTDRKAKLVLAFDRVELDGKSYAMSATVVDASEKMETGVGSEAAKLGIGAGLGTALGAVLGGKKGALIGAAVGGGGAILATEGKEVELPHGTTLHLRLDRDLTTSST